MWVLLTITFITAVALATWVSAPRMRRAYSIFYRKPVLPNSLVGINEHHARAIVVYNNQIHCLVLPVLTVEGRWQASAAAKHVEGWSIQLNPIVAPYLEQTRIIGLPTSAAQLDFTEVTVTLTPSPDDGSAPKTSTFVGAETITLTRPTPSALVACD